MSCPELSSVTNGSVDIITDGLTTSWTLSCSVGTSITETGTLTCQTDGTWSATQPSCGEILYKFLNCIYWYNMLPLGVYSSLLAILFIKVIIVCNSS